MLPDTDTQHYDLQSIYTRLNVHFLPKTGSVLGREKNFVACRILENEETNDKEEREADESPDLLTLFCIKKEDQGFERAARSSSRPPAEEKGRGFWEGSG